MFALKRISTALKKYMPKLYYGVKQRLTSHRQKRKEKTVRRNAKIEISGSFDQRISKVTGGDEISCPVCSSLATQSIDLEWNDQIITKHSCKTCAHLFRHRVLDGIEQLVSEFEYESKTAADAKLHLETRLTEKTIEEFRKLNGEFVQQSHLVFGVGKNFQLIENMTKIHSNQFLSVDGCDLNEREESNFFRTYTDDTKLGRYSSISSHAVIEHLENTAEAWRYMNRLLKPVNEADCIMVHAFPSLIHFGLDDWSTRIQSHTCLFSEKSLARICRISGFQLIETTMSSGHHPIFVFLKIDDL